MRGTWMRMLGGALAIGLLAGCNDTTTEVVQPETANVTGFVIAGGGPKAAGPGDGVMAYVSVSEAPVTPAVTLNGTPLGLEPEYSMYSNGFGFVGAAAAAEDGNATVAVAMGGQAAEAVVPVPGLTGWVAPASGAATLSPGGSLPLSWVASDGADGYWLSFSFEVDYTDTAGVSRYWTNDFSDYVTGTTYTLTAGQMLPPSGTVQSYDYFWGDGDVFPYSGPLAPGSAGNVTGDARGAVIGLSEPLDLDVDMVLAPTKAGRVERDVLDLVRAQLLRR